MPSPDHFSEIGGAVHAEAHFAKFDGETSENLRPPRHQLLARDLACSLKVGGGEVHAEAHLAKLDGEIASEPGARPGHQLLARDLACSLEVGGGELRHHVVERIHLMAHVFEESTPHSGSLIGVRGSSAAAAP